MPDAKGARVQLPTVQLVTMSIQNFLSSIAVTWVSYSEPILVSPASPLGVPLTRAEMDLAASLLFFGALTSIPTWHLPDAVGRKKTELLSGIIVTLGWALVATAKSSIQLLIARYISGIGFGIHLMIFLVYINEFSQVYIRGTMSCIPIFFYSFGGLISYTMGWFCSYHFIVYFNLVISVAFTVAINFLKESPVYLLTKGNDKEALKSLKFYRGTSKTTTVLLEELQYLKSQQEDSSYELAAKDEAAENLKVNYEKEEQINVTEMSAWKALVSSKATQRAMVTVTALCALSILMGLTVIQTYARQFFSIAAPDISPHLCSVIMAVAIAVGNALAVFITDLVPRRVLMITTCVVCAACLGALSSLLRWSWAPTWAAPLCVLLYCCAYTAGAGNLPMVQLAECFVPKVKVLASAVVMCTTCGCNFVQVALFAPAAAMLGLDAVFFVYFLITVIITVLAFFLMKETRGVHLEEIQGMYERGFLYWK